MATLKDLLQGKSGDEPQVDPQHLAEVQETVNTIVKTLKVFRTYPRENSISIGTVDELTRCLQEHLAKRRTLELFVDRHELQWQGVPVYSESDQRKSLALKLDRDGVRRMVFSGGIDRKEVVSMLEVLSAETDSESLTDDTVTLLWEKQLQHIRVYVLDEVSQGQESGFDQSLVDASAPSTPGASSQPGEEGTSARTHGSAAAGSPDVFHQELATAAARLSTVCGTTKMKLAPITEHHHQTIRRMADEEATKNVTEDLTDILFEIVRAGAQEQVFTNALHVLVELAFMNVKNVMFGKAVDILSTLRAFAAGEANISKELRALIVEHLQSLADPGRVQTIMTTVQEHENLNPEELLRLLTMLPAEAAPELCALLSVPRAERIARRAILHLIKDNPGLLAPSLAAGDVEAAKKILDVLEEAPVADFAEKLVEPLAAAPVEVKLASVKLLSRMKSDGAREILLGFVTADDTSLRRAALKGLSAFSAGKGQATLLREQVAAKDFDARPLDEKKTLLSVLTKLESHEAVPFLVDLAGQTRWFESRNHADTRACAVLALGEIDDARAREALERFASDRAQAVKTAARVALARHAKPVAAGAR